MAKMAEPTVERRNVIQLKNIPQSGELVVTLTGTMEEGKKGDFSDYYLGCTDSCGVVQVIGVKEDSMNYTALHELAEGDWDNLKGKQVKLFIRQVKSGAYAGKDSICIEAA
jgi:hypothetical protein